MGLLDVLQSASNAVAGNVAGPVDLLSFALRKAGIPIPEDALGGSEWMKRKGLMRDVPKGAEQVVGETLGLLAPTAIAANASKIARGLLQAQANAAAPKTLHPETGAIVWHGSPHKFDKFDASKIGTGEGAQAYGHGLYLAENPKVALSYKNDLATQIDVGGTTLLKANKKVGTTGSASVDDLLLAHNGDVDKAIQFVKSAMKDGRASRRGYAPELAMLEAMKPTVKTQNTGALYKVDLPDEFIPRMLDWDKPLSQQGAPVAQATKQLEQDFGGPNISRVLRRPDEHGGLHLHEALVNDLGGGKNYTAAAKYLRSLNIPGIRYLDANSRGPAITYDVGAPAKDFGPYSSFTSLDAAKQHLEQLKRFGFKDAEIKTVREPQTSNFVIFPGLEDQLKILERNGVPLGLLTP